MLTGDNRTTAEAVARRLGIDEVEAEVLPERKSEVVKRLRAEGRVVAMAGDGVNDAPALAAADVGIAMGTGTDIAMESAGVTLVKGDLTGILKARRLSAATMRNIRQNLFFAFVYNAAGVPIAAGVLYPVFGLAAVADRRGGGDGALLGQRHRECAEAAARRASSAGDVAQLRLFAEPGRLGDLRVDFVEHVVDAGHAVRLEVAGGAAGAAGEEGANALLVDVVGDGEDADLLVLGALRRPRRSSRRRQGSRCRRPAPSRSRSACRRSAGS